MADEEQGTEVKDGTQQEADQGAPAEKTAPEETLESVIEQALAEDDSGEEAAETSGTDTPAETEPEAAADEAADAPEGKESKESEPEKERPVGDKPGEEPEQAETDDDMPEGLSERAQKRFQALRERAVNAEQSVNQFTELLGSTGATPQEFGMLVEYARLVHSQSPQDTENALRILDAEREALAKRLGKELPGIDMLAEFPDLAQKVQSLDLEREQALEIAHARRQRAQFEQSQQAQQQQAQQQAQAQEAQQQAMRALDEMGARLAQSDPDYERKVQLLVQHSVPWIKQNLPPQQWPAAFENAYNQLGATLTAQSQSQPRARTPAPLRPAGTGGGSHRQPASMEDAIAQALAVD